MSTMPLRKTAIAVPHDVLSGVDDIARSRGESRSAFITRVLRAALRARRDEDFVRELNAALEKPAVVEEQRRIARQMGALASRRAEDAW
jgi:metal-responsive CopG/Arc/MetJ family transcriptional regulator